MPLSIDAYVGRDNARTIDLKLGGALVDADTVTRVVFRLGDYCLDTSEPTDPFELVENATAVTMQLGLWSYATDGTVTGTVTGHLVVYDAVATNGLAWPEGETINVTFHDWEACPA
jgi:hypothetical protein